MYVIMLLASHTLCMIIYNATVVYNTVRSTSVSHSVRDNATSVSHTVHDNATVVYNTVRAISMSHNVRDYAVMRHASLVWSIAV